MSNKRGGLATTTTPTLFPHLKIPIFVPNSDLFRNNCRAEQKFMLILLHNFFQPGNYSEKIRIREKTEFWEGGGWVVRGG